MLKPLTPKMIASLPARMLKKKDIGQVVAVVHDWFFHLTESNLDTNHEWAYVAELDGRAIMIKRPMESTGDCGDIRQLYTWREKKFQLSVL